MKMPRPKDWFDFSMFAFISAAGIALVVVVVLFVIGTNQQGYDTARCEVAGGVLVDDDVLAHDGVCIDKQAVISFRAGN